MPNAIKINHLAKVYKIHKNAFYKFLDFLFFIRPFGSYKEFRALSDINLSIKKGEVVGIIGKNGSGKSTLLKILAGIAYKTSGELYVQGDVSALLELGAGFNPEYSGIENIYLNGMVLGFKKTEIDRKLKDILEFAEIGDFVDRPVKTYSSGMFIRLAFSVAINVEPDILVVDEALAVGDARFQARCYKKFQDFKEMGKTIIFVTHDIDAVRKFCTRAVWINDGCISADGDVSFVTSKYMEYITKLSPTGVNQESKITQNNMEPINRFGIQPNLISAVESFKSGLVSHVFSMGDKIEVKIYLKHRFFFENNKNAAVSLSVKNKSGLDLFVMSTFDKNLELNLKTVRQICFKFPIILNVGEYGIAVSIEDRGTNPISYYDYVEGALYFKVISNNECFGIFNVPYFIEVTSE